MHINTCVIELNIENSSLLYFANIDYKRRKMFTKIFEPFSSLDQ